MRKKLRDSGGLTAVEMLCAVAILVLLCMMMNTGVQMAVRSYCTVTAESEIQLLCSSISDALADKLRFAVVTVDADGKYKECSVGEVGVDDGRVVVDGKALLPAGAYGNPRGAYRGNYQVAALSDKGLVTCNEDTNTFTVRFTIADTQLSIAQTAEFTVRCLSPVKEDTP